MRPEGVKITGLHGTLQYSFVNSRQYTHCRCVHSLVVLSGTIFNGVKVCTESLQICGFSVNINGVNTLRVRLIYQTARKF